MLFPAIARRANSVRNIVHVALPHLGFILGRGFDGSAGKESPSRTAQTTLPGCPGDQGAGLRVAHFDCFSGISGDMVLGAVIDAGVSPDVIRAALDSLGLPITLEIIVTNGRVFPYFDEKFWEPYRNQPAWEFARFAKIAESGHARDPLPSLKGEASQARERADLEASLTYTRNILNV